MQFKLPSAVTRRVARQVLVTKKHSPTLLFVGGIVGVGATVVSACRATLKLEELLEETQSNLDTANTLEHSDYSEKDRQKDKVYIYTQAAVKLTKLYGPAVVMGSISIGMLAGSHNILTKRNAGLTAAYAALDKGFRDYRDRVVEEYGQDKDRELRFGKTSESVLVEDKNGPKKVDVKTPGDRNSDAYRFLFAEHNLNWSVNNDYNVVFLRGIQYQMNDKLRSRGHVFLNEVLDALGMEHTKAGAITGWIYEGEGDGFIDLGVFSDSSNTKFKEFCLGYEGSVWLDFNVDGVIYDKI